MAAPEERPWHNELEGIIQSVTRALIFGIAFIYTMEAWWAGLSLELGKLVAFFIAGFLVQLYLTPVTEQGGQKPGLRRTLMGTTRSMGLAVLASAILLVTLGRVTLFSGPLDRDVAMIALLSIPIGIGGSVAQILQVYRGAGGDGQGQKEQKTPQSGSGPRSPWRFILDDVGSTVAGALFVALPLAPTGELPMLAAGLGYGREVAVVVLSLLVSHLMGYATGIADEPPSGKNTRGARIWPYADTFLSYGVSLLVALLAMYLFGRFEFTDPAAHILSLVVVLGLPATIGGAAGRLAL